ncbi:MAG TPA: hypothetical protein VMU53_14230 [Candidatus Sulfotelmatobacter sp.]|nr:hypothetical protein [Candidatus Sulfotelmatobacter sp.]
MDNRWSHSRRRFFTSAALVTGATLLNGCVRRIPAWLPQANPDYPLTIDVHCHFFNGTDLEMAGFISRTVNDQGKPWAGPDAAAVVQDIEWGIAPTAKSEKSKLKTSEGSREKAREKWRKAHAVQSNKLREQLQKPGAQADLRAHGMAVPTKQSNNNEPVKNGGLEAALKEYVQFRYVALFDYLELYNNDPSTNRTIDLAITHLVDYDWALSEGDRTRSPLNDQVELMKRISIASHGRVHTFAPFCPLREVAFRAGLHGKHTRNWSSLQMVQKWVSDGECIGVKMYPPMGFAPYGNEQIPPDFWDSAKWQWLKNLDPRNVPGKNGGAATIGQRLDEVLGEFYEWCLKEDVPVMAHTDLSNGLNTDFNTFTAAKYWTALASKYGKLRLNFGHLGDFEDTTASDWTTPPGTTRDVNARDLVALMSADATASGGRFYGDSGYTDCILTKFEDLKNTYEKALTWTAPGQSRPVLPDRILYGSDWSLLMLVDDMKAYFAEFVRMYSEIDPTGKLSAKFFGGNAVEYLGLQDGRTRKRLLDFYAKYQVKFEKDQQPMWMRKIAAKA